MEIKESKYLHLRPPREVVWTVMAFLAILTLFFGVKLKNEIRGYLPAAQATISVSGEGKVLAKPDIAIVNIGVLKTSTDLVSAQRAASEVISKVNDFLMKKGVEERDVKTTAYSIYPRYDYKDGEQKFRYYEVHQNFEVKIRDLTKVGEILSNVASLGANQIGSLGFTIDDPKKAKEEARSAAIKDAQEKAKILSRNLGVRLKKIVGYSESGSGFQPPIHIYGKAAEFGLGGDLPTPSGENEINVNVTITYRVK